MRGLALALSIAALLPTSARAQAVNTEAIHAVPVRLADRPMTLAEGSFRLDQGLAFRTIAFGLSAPNTLSVGLTDWLEIGLAWPYTRDPAFIATARFAHSHVVDVGVRVSAQVPAITTGDTDLIVSLPVVFRIDHLVRISTGVSGDFLLTQTMRPILRFPMSIAFSPSDRHFVSIDGAISLVDRHFWHGEIGLTYGHTVAATPVRPIGEVRIGAVYDTWPSGFTVTLGFSFWATVNPTQ